MFALGLFIPAGQAEKTPPAARTLSCALEYAPVAEHYFKSAEARPGSEAQDSVIHGVKKHAQFSGRAGDRVSLVLRDHFLQVEVAFQDQTKPKRADTLIRVRRLENQQLSGTSTVLRYPAVSYELPYRFTSPLSQIMHQGQKYSAKLRCELKAGKP